MTMLRILLTDESWTDTACKDDVYRSDLVLQAVKADMYIVHKYRHGPKPSGPVTSEWLRRTVDEMSAHELEV